MTKEQTSHELEKIRRGALTLNEYIKLSRVGESFTMTRKDKRDTYQLWLDECHYHSEKSKASLRNRGTEKGNYAYDKITQFRDEVLLESA